ncbi:putative tetratricopeptide repeat protein 41 [Sorex araneus]|uniref:putative tetratricopeptide repeat protein 41 n=1 Tax=Sorex araneus TaxID=42254 RepID=UPI00243391AF|nr:putative tetratricopeptide repeat protein 41 [Sorex araneus]
MSQLTVGAPGEEARSLLQAQKPIRPYICSAPKEFQEERDFLAGHIFPQLNECCHARGTYFKAVDLRWAELAAPEPQSPGRFRQHWCLSSQHLKLCLDYVNHCFPFFIALLGHTYGDFQDDYSPFMFSKATDLSGLSVIERNLYVAGQNGYPWVLDSPDCSLVEYEIMQAAFLRQSEFQYFYFRAGSAWLGPSKQEEEKEEAVMSAALMMEEEEKIRIGKLKSKIINRGLPVRYYKNLSELGELVLADWLVVIEKLYPASLRNENIDYKHDLERFYHQEFIEKCKQVFVVSKESSRTFDILEKFALSSTGLDDQSPTEDASLESLLRISTFPTYKSILLLSGERGCGKSTLIASWVNDFRSKYPDMLLVPHFVGSTCDSSDLMSVIHYFVTELQYENYGTLLKTDIFDEDESVLLFSRLIEAFVASISSKPCVLVLDGVEELIGTHGISGQKAKDFSWLPHPLSPGCRLVLSSVSSSLSCKALCARPDVRVLELGNPWHEDARAGIFRQHFIAPNDNYPFCRYRHILKRRPHLSALKLAVLSTELNECRVYRDELQCLKEFLDAGSTQELWALVLKRWAQDYSWAVPPAAERAGAGPAGEGLDGWVASALSLLSLSHCGLTEEEIFQLLDMLGYRGEHRVSTLHWAAFRNATRQWVREKPSGVLYFQHQSLRAAVEHRLLGALAPVRENSLVGSANPPGKILGLYETLISFFRRHTAFWRVFQELPWYLKESQAWQDLCTFLSSPSVVDLVSKLPSPSFWMGLHLVHYWDVLSKVSYDATQAYLSTVTRINAGQCRKGKRRPGLSALECRTFEVTVVDKCRLLFFIGKFLKFLGKTSEAEDLFLNVENILLEQSQPVTEMLLDVQNTLGELYLDMGMAQEGSQYFGKVSSNLTGLSLSDFQGKKELVKQNVRALSNLVKSASKEYLRENHVLESAVRISYLMDRHPCNEATMKHTEGVLMFLAGNTCLAKAKLYECLYIRKRLFGGKSILVGETMEFLADLLSFPPRDCEKVSRKQAIEFYKEVIRIRESSGARVSSPLVRKQRSLSLSDTLCKLASQLLLSDSSGSVLTEAMGHLYRSLDLRTTHLGSAHPSVPGILHLLQEIESLQSQKGWAPAANGKYWESGRKGNTVRELLLRLNCHAARSGAGLGYAGDTRAGISTRCTKVLDLTAYLASETSEGAPGKGKTDWRSRTAEEKTQQEMQERGALWEEPEQEAAKKTDSSKTLPVRETGG